MSVWFPKVMPEERGGHGGTVPVEGFLVCVTVAFIYVKLKKMVVGSRFDPRFVASMNPCIAWNQYLPSG